MKKALIIMTFSAMAAGCADNSIPKAQLPELDTTNPLLAEWNTPHQTPPFSQIELSDYEPAFDAAIACSRAEIEAIVNNPKKPTFGNTIVALERQGALLDRISGVFYNLLEAATSDQMQEIALRVQPKLTELSNDVSLNPELFARVKAVYEKPGRGLPPSCRPRPCSSVRTRWPQPTPLRSTLPILRSLPNCPHSSGRVWPPTPRRAARRVGP